MQAEAKHNDFMSALEEKYGNGKGSLVAGSKKKKKKASKVRQPARHEDRAA